MERPSSRHLGLTGCSYDNTGDFRANTWRHVAFIEKIGHGEDAATEMPPFQSNWLMMSDVCKHCERSGCLEACPTGAIFRTEFDTVVVQQDICNGCGYCVPACPFGVVDLEHGRRQGAQMHALLRPAERRPGAGLRQVLPDRRSSSAKLTELRERARSRLAKLRRMGRKDAYLYGLPNSPGATGGIGSLGAFFLLLARPGVYNLPEAPQLPSPRIARSMVAGAGVVAGIALAGAFIFSRQKSGNE